MHDELETDYLVVGAGAAGMAFTDALLSHSDATVTIVDRRHAPGGHWLDAYPYVRLHQPSVPLRRRLRAARAGRHRHDRDERGLLRARRRERAEGLLRAGHASPFPAHGRVQYFPSSDYVGEQRFVSRLTGASWHVRVRRKLVDTTYLEGEIPATSPPPFAVAEGVRCVTPSRARSPRAAARALRRSSAEARPRSTRACGSSSRASRPRRSAGSGRAKPGG